MQFRMVEGKTQVKDNQKKATFDIKYCDVPEDEQVPKLNTHDSMTKFINNKKTQKLKFRANFLINQDPRKSSFSHGKLMAIQKLSGILSLLIFFLSCTKTEIDIYYSSTSQPAAYIMNCISICVLALIFVLFLRHIALFELQVVQNKVYVNNNKKQWIFLSFIEQTDRIKAFLLEMIIIAPHPMTFLVNARLTLYQTYDQIYLTHSINDILSLLLVAKVYIVIRSLLNITIYSSPRSSRLCYQNGFQHNHLYSIKCILNDMPLKIIAINFGLFIIIGGYCLKLSQGVLFMYNAGYKTGFQNYANCFWCIFITMATVGYGDYYPKTMPGRMIIIFIAIFGVLLSSLLIVSLTYYLEMIPSQTKSHVIIQRLQQQQQLVKQASAAVAYTIKVKQLMNQQKKNDHQLESQFENLRKKIENAQNKSKKIKSLVDNDNIIQQMSRLFFILRDNLKDLFIGQLKLKEQIGNIEEIQSIKMSFKKQVSQMLSKTENSKPSTSKHSSEKSKTSRSKRVTIEIFQ